MGRRSPRRRPRPANSGCSGDGVPSTMHRVSLLLRAFATGPGHAARVWPRVSRSAGSEARAGAASPGAGRLPRGRARAAAAEPPSPACPGSRWRGGRGRSRATFRSERAAIAGGSDRIGGARRRAVTRQLDARSASMLAIARRDRGERRGGVTRQLRRPSHGFFEGIRRDPGHRSHMTIAAADAAVVQSLACTAPVTRSVTSS